MKKTIHPDADKVIARYEAKGYTIQSVISCKNYTRVITNHGIVHIHH